MKEERHGSYVKGVWRGEAPRELQAILEAGFGEGLKGILRRFGTMLGPSWDILRHLGPSWGHLEEFGGHLESILEPLGAS